MAQRARSKNTPKNHKKAVEEDVKKAVEKHPIVNRLTVEKVKYGPPPKSDIKPVVQPEWEPPTYIKKTHTRTYLNRERHPECQDIDLTAGYQSAHIKQLEILEEVQRALIDVTIAGLPEPAKTEMSNKYSGLI